jgi:hypothetical protein
MIDKDTAINLLNKCFTFNEKPTRVELLQISGLIESLSAKADEAEKLCCLGKSYDDSVTCANCFLLGVCMLRAGGGQG